MYSEQIGDPQPGVLMSLAVGALQHADLLSKVSQKYTTSSLRSQVHSVLNPVCTMQVFALHSFILRLICRLGANVDIQYTRLVCFDL